MTQGKSIDVVETLDLLNFYLHKKGISRTFIICGGASLILQNVVRPGRATADIDLIAPEIDEALREAALHVADTVGLSPHWLNSDPKSLVNDMAAGWESRIIEVYTASNLVVFSISRSDMIFSKFYAFCDRQKDLNDLIDLKVTAGELREAANLTKQKDTNELWPAYVEEQYKIVLRELANG